MHVRPYEKLIVWQEAHKLCLRALDLTGKFPKDERFRLVHQMCKSAYSVPMNIAEGIGGLGLFAFLAFSHFRNFRFWSILP